MPQRGHWFAGIAGFGGMGKVGRAGGCGLGRWGPGQSHSGNAGHSSAVVTLNVYSHVLPHTQDEAADRMEALLRGAEENAMHTGCTQQPSAGNVGVV